MSLEMEPRPVKVRALKDFLIYIKFKNGEERIYDMKRNFKYQFYKNLQDVDNFKKIRISGINVEWESGEDIAPENLYNESEPIANYEISVLEDL